MTTARAPDLEPHCGSWIIRKHGKPVFETFERRVADQFAAHPEFEVLTAAQHLAALNEEIRDDD